MYTPGTRISWNAWGRPDFSDYCPAGSGVVLDESDFVDWPLKQELIRAARRIGVLPDGMHRQLVIFPEQVIG